MKNSKIQKYLFRLYVAGAKPQSSRAIANLKKICETHLNGQCELEVIDIYQDPDRATHDEVLAVPTLVKESPGDKQKLVGDLSDEKRVLEILGIAQQQELHSYG